MDNRLYNLIFKGCGDKPTVIKGNGETKIGVIIREYLKK